MLHTNLAQTTFTRSDARTDALRDVMSDLLGMDEPRKRYGAMMSGPWPGRETQPTRGSLTC